MLVAENQHLEAMVHKYRTEYDVVSAHLHEFLGQFEPKPFGKQAYTGESPKEIV